ncbi:MAG: hypothetical protein ABII79_05460 [bacterium]
MLNNTYSTIAAITITAAIVITVSAATVSGSPVVFDSHSIALSMDVPTHTATIRDTGTFQTDTSWNHFYLNPTAQIVSFTVAKTPADYYLVRPGDTAELPVDLRVHIGQIVPPEETLLVFFRIPQGGRHSFDLSFQAVFHKDMSGTRFSRERVGSEISGTILEVGAYLSSAALFYPQGDDGLMHFRLTVNIPDSWESVSDGNLVTSDVMGNRKVQTWENPFQSDGCQMMAAPYVVRSTQVDGIEVFTYFFEADTGLCQDYLAATADYIRMYSDLIGPYPYSRFTVAENFFPTGYGMPAWTLLGQRVLRLPFIIGTSLGHEVLHNWWGNSVYVDYDRGNWCEAATVYGADYRYKLQQSAAAARDYRKDILKQYVSLVNEENDFPVRRFRSRTSPETRTIGYNKGMMIYHMIEREIGTAAFFESWQQIYREQRGQQISWEEWIEAFEQTSGRTLDHVIPQWIDRTGAPMLALDIVTVASISETDSLAVQFRLSQQSNQPYRLLVPLRFSGEEFILDTIVLLDTVDSLFSMTVPAGITTLTVDPDYHLFRRLYPDEIEPILSVILNRPNLRFVLSAGDSEDSSLAATFGINLTEDSVIVEPPEVLQDNDRDYLPILINPTELPPYLRQRVTHEGLHLVINGTTYKKEGHTFVLTGADWDGFERYLVILSDDLLSLPRIGQLVPHYGKYSFLVFEDARNVGKGQWEVTGSPLQQSLLR